MQTTAFSARQSRNLTPATDLYELVCKSVSKFQIRRQWLRANVITRRWCRRAIARHDNLLLCVAAVSGALGFFGAIIESDTMLATFSFIALAALTPEMLKLTYEKPID